MNTENKLHEQLDALNKMSLDELRDLCRKYYPGAKNCRSKMLLRKKISFMLQAEVLGNLDSSTQQQISELGLGQPRVKNSKGFVTGTTFTRKWKDRTYRLVAVADGFVMNGQKFKSLSGAAMAVTGTQWSGKVFWKVK